MVCSLFSVVATSSLYGYDQQVDINSRNSLGRCKAGAKSGEQGMKKRVLYGEANYAAIVRKNGYFVGSPCIEMMMDA